MNKYDNEGRDEEISKLKLIVETQKNEIFQLKNILANVPGDVYWKNKEGVWQGLNATASDSLRKMGFIWKKEDVVGKNDYEIFGQETADIFRKNDLEIMDKKIVVSCEEEAILPSGEKIIQLSTKRPLLDEHDEAIGIVGITINITAEKEAERLKIENEKNQQTLKEQEKFTKIVKQVAHDIRSPLASLLMIVKSCNEIPEAERIALREAAIIIGDIANNLLNRYVNNDAPCALLNERVEPMLVSATLLQLLTDKKYEYQNLFIKLDHEFTQAGNFAFINVSFTDFKRMLSNLINNAKDAFDPSDKNGKISIRLDANMEWVTINIQDSGKGMSPKLIEKIKQNIAFTEGKKEGYGIGLTQVRDTLARYQGEISILSEVGAGTIVSLMFPRIIAPDWIQEEINLRDDDTIVILDDDYSIHTAWDARFDWVLKQCKNIELKHFHYGEEALAFLNTLTATEIRKIFLLTDFELLKQELNGLDVIEKSGVQRSLLVTSHYMDPALREQAAKMGTKILPKQLSSEIHITLEEAIPNTSENQINLVIVDDDKKFANHLKYYLFSELEVDCYQNPYDFLSCLSKYQKTTKILLDNNFDNSYLKGLEIAEILHKQGFVNLYLITGDIFREDQVPKYLKMICKDDITKINEV